MLPGITRYKAGSGPVRVWNDEGGVFSSTLTGHSIGAARSDRLVVVRIVGTRAGNTGRTLSSATIGGVAATILTQKTCNSAGKNCNVVAIIAAIVPTGTTADIALTWSGAMDNNIVQVVALVGVTAPSVPVDAQTAGVDGTVTTLSATIARKAGGIVLAVATGRNALTTTWSGLTEDYDSNDGANTFTHAKALSTVATSLSLSATFSSSAQRGALAAVSLR